MNSRFYKLFTSAVALFVASAATGFAQNVTVFSKEGGRIDFKEGDVISIEFSDVERQPLTPPATAESVDLGLSVKWATCNVGATKPEDAGAYLAWGEKAEKSEYNWANYFDENCDRPLTAISGMDDYDVAAAEWGGDWRLPTLTEMQELCDRCTWSWTEQNGTKGCLVTGPNGGTIFLPASGTRQGTSLYLSGSYGSFLTGTRDSDNHFYARSLVFFSTGEHWIDTNLRDYGQTVRAVCK